MNRKLISTAVFSVLFTLALAGGAVAQQKEQQKEDAPVTAVVVLGITAAQTDAVAAGLRASKLLHADVYNDNNQKIGKIGDLIIAPDGTLSVAIVDVGGFLGLGKRRVAIPVGQFSQIAPKVVLPGATKEALKQLPEFKSTES